MAIEESPLGRILSRHATVPLQEALADTRVVLVNGARQCGKSTLVRQLAQQSGAEWFSLDSSATLQAAQRDPVGFVRAANPMVVDEIQRAPELLLAIKEVVDSGYDPGRFLLTGSARVLGLRGLPDTLPGRMETIELWPLSQGEIDGQPDRFIDAVFRDGAEISVTSAETRDGYIRRLVRGGFPVSVAREGKRRTRFLEQYVADLVNRDVTQLSSIEYGRQLRQLITVLAGRVGGLLNTAGVANSVGLPRATIERYLALLEEIFLIKRIPAWSHSAATRATNTPKIAFVDSGVTSMLLGQDETSLGRITSDIGGVLESFVAMELARQITWAEQFVELFHYRTRDQIEVDIILQNRRGDVVGIEVKASSSVADSDFSGLRHLQAKLGRDMLAGFVLYLGQQSLPFGDRLRAIPLSALWTSH